MKSPGRYSWREWLVLGSVLLSVLMSWGLPQLQSLQFLGDRWLLEWGVGAFYAMGVLAPLAWYRSLSLPRWVCAGLLSMVAWHFAAQLASEGFGPSGGATDDRFVLRSLIAGFFGAVVVSITPLARPGYPGWERHLAKIGLA